MPFVLIAHSWLRWLVLIAGFVALVRGLGGWSGGRPWSGGYDRAGRLFTVALDIQVLLGIVLYGYFGNVTRMDHIGGMALALVLAHVGRVRIRRASAASARHRTAAIFIGLSLLVILGVIPWRAPLLRF